MPGRDPGGTRYSTLTQITPANVSQLKVAWVYHMKPAGTGSLHPSEDQPLVIGSTMYVVTPYSRVVALDSATGHEQWMFQIPDGDQASIRGADYWPGGEGAGPAASSSVAAAGACIPSARPPASLTRSLATTAWSI